MLDVFFTIDVEIWCDGWKNIDKKFPEAFRKYIYGSTPSGEFGLQYQLEILNSYGLSSVCFVEPLFATRFGTDPLMEILGLIKGGGTHEIQLHLHPEWVDEALQPLLPVAGRKRRFLREFSLEEQTSLITTGSQLIERACGRKVTAFRAGSFGFDRNTLLALANSSIRYDSSYNASMNGPCSGMLPGTQVVDTLEFEGVYEYPMTVFNDGRVLRHAQLTACSFRELEGLLWQALERKHNSFVILSHNFELLNPAKTRPDPVVVRRLKKLCSFLSQHPDCFNIRGFDYLEPVLSDKQPDSLQSPRWRTMARSIEQLYRRRHE